MKSFLVLAILSTVICVSVSASAATLHVDGSVSSSGDGTSWETAFKTIQEGIDAASHGDTVTVAEGVYVENIQFKGKNITLTSGDPLNPAVVEKTIIDGNQAGSVVSFWGDEGETCVLSGFTIRNGKGGDCGGIYGGWHECDALIAHNIITGNTGSSGGGLYGCNGLITDNVISGNTAQGSGGGLKWCEGVIKKNVISSNTAAEDGGGLCYCDGLITDNVISGNSAWWDDGGGLCWCDGTIQNNVISGNSANGVLGDGGGLALCEGIIENNMIVGNSAGSGGGLAWCNGTIQGNTIAENSAEWDDGGGLTYCLASIRNCVIWANVAAGSGNQIWKSHMPSFSCIQNLSGGTENINKDPAFVDSVKGDYHLQDWSPCIDAGVNYYWFAWPQRALDGSCRLAGDRMDMGCYEYNSSPDSDGDMLSDSDESAAGTNTDEQDTDGDGLRDGLEKLRGTNPLGYTSPGVLHVPSQMPTIQAALCLALNGEEVVVAPARYQENLHFCGADVVLRSLKPDDLHAVASTIIDGGGSGPVVSFRGGESEACVLAGFTIQNGRAEYGGGICGGTLYPHTHATIQNCIVSQNWATEEGGGLAYCYGIVQNNTISRNSGEWGGGGLYFCGGTIQNNLIYENSTEWGGGALAWCDGSILTNLICGNSAGDEGGGFDSCNATIENNTITGNSAALGGGLYDCRGTLRNCVIWGNVAWEGPQIHASSAPSYCCIQDWTGGGEGNISEDPRFIDADGLDDDPQTYDDNDYHLSPGSPCIDAGADEDWMPDAVDIDGEPRVDWIADIGADEYYWRGVANTLIIDASATCSIVTGDRHTYQISTLADQNLLITVDSTPNDAAVLLYARYGTEPERHSYDYRSEGHTETSLLVIPDTLEGDYYVLIYGASVPGTSASYTIKAQYVDLYLGSVSPSQAGNAGCATLSIFGAGLDEISKLSLVGPGGQVIAPVEVIPSTSTQLSATFYLKGADQGLYDIAAQDVKGHFTSLEDAFEVTAGAGPELWVDIEGPDRVRLNRIYTYRLRYGNSGDVDAYGVSMFVELTPDVIFRVQNSDEWQTSRPGQAIHIVFTVVGACSEGIALLTIRIPDAMSVNICADITEDPAQYLDLHSDRHGDTLKLLNEMVEGTRTNEMRASGIIPCAEVDTYPPKTGPWEPRPPGYIDLFEIRQPGGSSSYESAVSLGGEELAWSFPAPVDGVVTTPLSSLNLPYGGWEVKHLGSWRPSPSWGVGKKWSELREEVKARLQPYAGYGFNARSEGDGRISCIGLAGRVSLGEDYTEFVPDLNADGYRDIYEVMSWIWACNGVGVAAEWWSIGDRKRAIRALDDFLLTMVGPCDPNEKVGPAGTDDQRAVGVAEELQYIIYFENQPGATAPAQEVFVRDYLDPALDLATFRPTEVAFGDRIIAVSDTSGDFYTRETIEDYRGLDKKWWVDITVELDYSSRLAKWTFRTLDPETGELAKDDLAGFLPPNDPETGCGEGHVAYTVQPKSDTPPGTVIRNIASIVFDVQPPVLTNKGVPVENTIAYLVPEAPAWPRPADGAQNVAPDAFLDWASSQRAETYDVYLWKQEEARPIVPTAGSLTRSDFQPSPRLEPETLYHWQVSARNISGEAPGPEWTFSTEPVGFRVVGLGWLPNGRLRIEFPSLSGRSYSLEGRDSFDSAVWAPQQFYITQDGTAAQTSIQGTGTILRIYAWPAGSRAFYRVATP